MAPGRKLVSAASISFNESDSLLGSRNKPSPKQSSTRINFEDDDDPLRSSSSNNGSGSGSGGASSTSWSASLSSSNRPKRADKSSNAYYSLDKNDTRPPPVCRCCCRCCSRKKCFIITPIAIILVIGLLLVGYFVILPLFHEYDPHIEPSVRVPPGPPTTPAAAAITPQTVTVRWSPPNDTGTAQILYYQVYVCDGGSGNGTLPNSTSTTAATTNASCTFQLQYQGLRLNYTRTALNASTTYCFAVRAHSSVGNGNFSDVACYDTAPPGLPFPPPAVQPLSTTRTSIVLNWTAADGNGAPITHYQLEYKLASDTAWTSLPLADVLAHTLVNLAIFATYDIRIAAANAVGTGNFSAVYTFHTDASTAKAPPAPSTPVAQAIDFEFAVLSWHPPSTDNKAEIVLYNVFLNVSRSNGTVAFNVSDAYEQYPTTAVLSSFSAGDLVCAKVRAYNSQGWGPFSEALCFHTLTNGVPAAMDAPVLANTSPTMLLMDWTAPDDRGSPITNYTLERDDWWVDGDLAPVYAGLALSFQDNYTSVGLLPATTYHYRVRAANQFGDGGYSSVAAFTTDRNGKCGNPADIQVYKATKSTMKGDIQGCMIKCIASGNQCAVDCISSTVGLSPDCASCWADEGDCTLSRCAGQCLIPTSSACAECSESECFPDCVLCSGVPRFYFPP